MAIQNKTALQAAIVALPNPITPASLKSLLANMVDSWEDIIQEYTTTQRNAISGPALFQGLKIFNTTSSRMEFYSGAEWLPCSQKATVAVDCSANPNYPEGLVGDQYIVSVAGVIGGGSGKVVYVGDIVYCITDNAGGNEASAGTKWKVCHSAFTGAQLKKATLTIVAADVLNLGSVPKTIIPAVSGKAIQIVSGSVKATYGSSPYAVSGNNIMIGVSPSARQADLDVTFSGNIYRPIRIYPTPIDNSLIVNTAVAVSAATGVTGGDSDITITVFYLEI